MLKQSKWLVPAMVLSVVLITAFQLFWISNSYQSERKNLQVESTIMLREIFYERWRGKKGSNEDWEDMENRRRFMLPASGPSDTSRRLFRGTKTPHVHGSREFHHHHEGVWHSHDSTGFHSHEADSTRCKAGNRNQIHRHSDNFAEPSMISRLQPDSLLAIYGPALKAHYPSLQPKIVIHNSGDTLSPPAGTLRTLPLNWDWSKGQTICAEITGIGPVLFRKLLPHMATSLVILITTTTTMLLLYRTFRRSNRLAARQRQFVSDVTHELKTPISTVSIALEAMKNFHSLDNKQKTEEYLEISMKEVTRLTSMVERMLQLSQMESGKAQLTFETCDLAKIAMDCSESLQSLARQNEIELSYVRPEFQCLVLGDVVHLSSALSNLIENALKYSPKGSKVTVQVKDLGSRFGLLVEDNGPGIERDEHQRIFEKFYRIRTGDRHNVKGYGLGLSYVKEVAHLHNGEVRLDSIPGDGSVFYIIIPKQNNEKN